jgi:CheY-like chemotaxis protein
MKSSRSVKKMRPANKPGRQAISSRREPQPILLVEDHNVARATMKSLLEWHGYVVTVADSGPQALHVLRNGLNPCLILLDVDMRGQGAYQFRREQLHADQLAAIPIVAYSGLYDPKIAAAKLRAVAYFSTPFDLARFLGVLETHCPRQRSAA